MLSTESFAQQEESSEKTHSTNENNNLLPIDPKKPSYFPRDLTDSRPGYDLYTEDGNIDFWLDFESVDNFESQMFDWSKPNYPRIMPSDKLSAEVQSELLLQEPQIDWDSKISPELQRNLKFIKMYLGQSMTAEKIDNLYYKMYVETNDSTQLPDYAKSLRTTAVFETLDTLPPNHQVTKDLKNMIKEHDAILLPISKLDELALDDNVTFIADASMLNNLVTYGDQELLIPEGLQFISNNFVAPNQQLENGIPSIHVKCNNDLILMLKSSDLSPICVTQNTSQKLLDRNLILEV